MAKLLTASDLRNKSVSELNDEMVGLRKEAFNLRMQMGNGQQTNTARMTEIRRSVARIKTVLREMKSQQAS